MTAVRNGGGCPVPDETADSNRKDTIVTRADGVFTANLLLRPVRQNQAI
jgi:hypothetical protein